MHDAIEYRPRLRLRTPAEVGREITRRKDALGYSSAELARKVGVDRAYVWQWEHGQRPRGHLLRSLVQALNCSFSDLLTDAGNATDQGQHDNQQIAANFWSGVSLRVGVELTPMRIEQRLALLKKCGPEVLPHCASLLAQLRQLHCGPQFAALQ